LRPRRDHHDWQTEIAARAADTASVAPTRPSKAQRIARSIFGLALPATVGALVYVRAATHPTVERAIVLVLLLGVLPPTLGLIGAYAKRRVRAKATGDGPRESVAVNPARVRADTAAIPQTASSRIVRWVELLFVWMLAANIAGLVVLGHQRALLGAILAALSTVGGLGLFATQLMRRAATDQLSPEEREALRRRLLRDIAAELSQFAQQRPREPVYEHWLQLAGKRLAVASEELAAEWKGTTLQPPDGQGLVSAGELRARHGMIERHYRELANAAAAAIEFEPAARVSVIPGS
jgi:hypothetical protein